MSTSEITAYLHGAACRDHGLPVAAVFLTAAKARLHGGDRELTQAHAALGNDRFAYWVRRGYDEAGSCHA